MSEEELIFSYTMMFLFVVGLFFAALKFYISGTVDALKRYGTQAEYSASKSLTFVAAAYLCIILGFVSLNGVFQYSPPPPIKLIMLDIDGVLNTSTTSKQEGSPYLYEPACVARLNTLILSSEAKIIVCSSWRAEQSLESMQKILGDIGIKGEVIGLTPEMDRACYTRDDELIDWLDNFPDVKKIDSLVLISNHQSKNLAAVQVSPSRKDGFTDKDLVAAKKLLSDGLPKNFNRGTVRVCRSEVYGEMNFGGHYIQKEQLKQ